MPAEDHAPSPGSGLWIKYLHLPVSIVEIVTGGILVVTALTIHFPTPRRIAFVPVGYVILTDNYKRCLWRNSKNTERIIQENVI